MRPLIFSLIFLFANLTLASAEALKAKEEFEKIIEKEFPITAAGEVDIVNKYGAVNISAWDKDAVSIVVSITVKASSQGRADDVFDRIDINFKNDKAYVMAHTEIESASSWSIFSWGSDSDFQINYEVKMPNTNHLKLRNKYGNSYLPELSNGADLSIGYGKLRMGDIKGETKMVLSYSNAEFLQIDDLNLEMKYSGVKGNSTGDISIESKYSSLKINEARNIRSDSKYDGYDIGTVEQFINDGKYDDIKIGNAESVSIESGYSGIDIKYLIGSLDIDQKFGSINVEKMECGTGDIEIQVKYTNVKIGLEACNNYDLRYNGAYTDIKGGKLKSKVESDGKHTSMKTSAGNGSKKIDLKMEYGSIRFDSKKKA